MDEKKDKNLSEDEFADVDFSEEDELKNAEFVSVAPTKIKLTDTKEEKTSQFYDDDNKLLAEKIIEKKTGKIIEIKYNAFGKKDTVTEFDKDRVIRKQTIYYEGGSVKMVTDYARDASYKSLMYNVDGSWLSYVDKHSDGTADTIYYNADNKGTNVHVKLDADKQVIEKRIEKL